MSRLPCELLPRPAPSSSEGHGQDLARARDDYLSAILLGNRRGALKVVSELYRRGESVTDIYVDVLQDAMYLVGALWEAHKITVADEHLATIVTQQVLAELYSTFEPSTEKRGPVLITGVANELHQLGAHMVADVLDAQGWDVRFLGTYLPEKDILQAVEAHAPRVLGISTTMSANVPAARALVRAVRERYGAKMHILVGGSAFRLRPELAAEIGADTFAEDVRSTLSFMLGSPLASEPAEASPATGGR